MITAAPQLLDAGIQLITGLAEGLVTSIPAILTALGTCVTSLLDYFKELLGIHSPSTVFADFGMNLINGLINGITGMIEAAKTAIGTIGTKITDGFVAIIGLALGWGTTLITKVVTGITNTVGDIGTAAGKITAKITGVITGISSLAMSWGSSIIGNVATGITNTLSNIGDAATKITTKIKDAITGLAALALGWGTDMIAGLIKGITDSVSKVGDAAKKVADKITSFIHFSRPDEGPLRDYETWMPDMMSGLSEGIRKNTGRVVAETIALSQAMTDSLSPTLNMDALASQQTSGQSVQKRTAEAAASQARSSSYQQNVTIQKFINNRADDVKKLSQDLGYYHRNLALDTGGTV
jgi:phage-related protein